MARYLWNEKTHKLELIDPDGYKDPNRGLNGPVYCPDHGYFDPILNRRFESKTEKRNYMREHGLMMHSSSKEQTAGNPGKTYYFIPGMKNTNRYYKHR